MVGGVVTIPNPALSMLQSAADAYARTQQSSIAGLLQPHEHPMVAATAKLAASADGRDQRATELSGLGASAEHCAKLGLDMIKAHLSGDPNALAAAKNAFIGSTCDPKWAETVTEYAEFIASHGNGAPIPGYKRYQQLTDFILPEIPADARIGVIGDWGTGTPLALDTMKLLASKEPDIVIHLGDIYYSGTATECLQNFLSPATAILSPSGSGSRLYSLSGNHDMYAGGDGYYAMIAELGQPSSYFVLRSEDLAWQFLAMDTGYSDHNPFDVTDVLVALDPQEEAWHVDKVTKFTGSTILLSHHQLFSAYAAIGPIEQGRRQPFNPNLLNTFQMLQENKPVAAWFWGHEHAFTVYETYLGLQRGRCLGHGAIPTSEADNAYQVRSDIDPAQVPPVRDGLRPPLINGLYDHGFAMLTLGAPGGAIRADYYSTAQPDAAGFSEIIPPVATP
jgi:hypothetical protein